MTSKNRIHCDMRKLRLAAGEQSGVEITAAGAAALIVVSTRAWLRWENNHKTVPVGVIRRFCAVTGLNPQTWIPQHD